MLKLDLFCQTKVNSAQLRAILIQPHRKLKFGMQAYFAKHSWCLEGVWKVSGGCLDGVWMVSGWCLDGVRMAYTAYNVVTHIYAFFYFAFMLYLWCLDGVLLVSCWCPDGVWKVSGPNFFF